MVLGATTLVFLSMDVGRCPNVTNFNPDAMPCHVIGMLSLLICRVTSILNSGPSTQALLPYWVKCRTDHAVSMLPEGDFGRARL